MKKRITILLAGLFYLLQIQAQHQPFFINTTEAEGLSDNRVTCFYQDKKGYTWVGTENGLNRYNGRSFKIYQPLSAQKHQLSDPYITSVAQDNKAHTWISTRKGLNRIDANTDTTEIIQASIGDRVRLPFENVWDVLPENDSSIWIAVDTKPFLKYDALKKKLHAYDFRQFLLDNKIEYTPRYHSIFKIVPYSADELWLATTEGIFRFNKRTGKFTLVYGVALDRISYFRFEPETGKLYCADERNILYIYHSNDGKMATADLGAGANLQKPLLPYTAGRNGVFIPTPEGLAWISKEDEVVGFVTGRYDKENSLLPGRITTVFKDSKGISWVGTEKGMSRFVPSLNANLHISLAKNLQYDNAYSLKNFIYNSNRNEWLITSYSDNTLWRVNNETGKVALLTRPFPYNNDTCYAFYARHPDTLFLLCNSSLLTYHTKTNEWKKISFPSPWKEGTLTCMAIDRAGKYWLGTRRKGIFVFDPVQKTIWAPVKDQLDISIIHALQYDPYHNSTWIGSYSNGLYQFSEKDSLFRNIPRNDSTAGALHSSLINDLAVDRVGNTWCASREGGLAKLSSGQTTSPVITSLETKDGLPDNTIFSVDVDRYGQPWFNTSRGIGWISADGKRKAVFNRHSGLPYSKFPQSIACVNGDIVATIVDNCFFSFYSPALLRSEDNNLVIDRIQLNDTVLINPSRSSFGYKDNTIRFDFSLLDFTAPDAIDYYCKLEGFDKDWINNGRQGTVRYAGLAPGKYTFRVRAKKTDGTFNQQEGSWSFVIASPFWQTTWFKLSLLAVVIFLASWLYRRRIQKIREDERVKNDYEKRIAETEMQALRAQMNPHFMFNSLNSINNFILKNDPDNASGYLTKFSRLMRLILDNSRSEWVQLENELKALELYIELEAVRFDHAFEYSLAVSKDIRIETVMVPPLIIQPYVENAIWHGLLHRKKAGGRLTIRLWKNNGNLYIEVEDNGVGRDEALRLKSKTATRQKSHGMKITAERMEIVNKVYNVGAGVTIVDLNNAAGDSGTRVLITLKYQTYESDHRG